MISANRVVWHEGMFLLPQHMQQQDRYIEGLINHRQRMLDNNFWGFSELTLDLELLPVGKIGISSAIGMFPDGTYFNIPATDHTPKPFEIPEGLSNALLFLALPLKKSDVADVGNENSKQLFRYNAVTANVQDSTADSNESTELQVGSVACRILTEHQDLSGYTCLPIARVKESRTNHHITFDKTFLTTWLDVHETASLGKFVTEVHGLLNHRADMLAARMSDTQQAGSSEMIDFMLLQVVNRYETLFHYLMNKKPLHPEQLFCILIQLMGEMATYTNNKRRPIEPPVYKHADLFNTFKPIIMEVRQQLSTVLEQNAVRIPLQERQNGLWVGMVPDKALFKTAHFVLSVYADVPTETIRANFASQVKVASVEQVKALVSKLLPGVPVGVLGIAPRQIPFHNNYSYFGIDTTHELWAVMEKAGGIAIHVGHEYPSLKLELWAIKG